ncbi:MAG: tRNA lysidine(34) synthetase TilS [Planctomycetaceae bacterium]|nr:tRNA lysidine(34) synthetase TilS [Planctomycetaceae bacterium]
MSHFSADHDLPARVLAGLQAASVSPQDRLILAVSGGLDSVALLHAVCRIRSSRDQLAVAHLDHGLRPSSIEDRRFVERLASQLQVRCIARSLAPDHLKTQPGSREEAARAARYEFLQEAAAEFACGTVVTAHHRADQAETVMHNLLRGTGLRGLGGLRIQRPLTESIRLVRPLRDVSRSEIQRFVADQGLSHCVDESNADTTFTRNRLRRETLPQLQTFNPQLEQVLASLADQAGAAVQIMDEFALILLRQCLLEQQPHVVRLHREPLCQLTDAARRHLLSLLWSQQRWSKQKLTADHWHELSQLLRHSHGRLDLPGSVCATTTAQMVRFIRADPQAEQFDAG